MSTLLAVTRETMESLLAQHALSRSPLRAYPDLDSEEAFLKHREYLVSKGREPPFTMSSNMVYLQSSHVYLSNMHER